MFNIIHAIVQNYIENSKCFSIVAKDGITTDQFAIHREDVLFVKASMNVRYVQFRIPAILGTVSVAKNLDYYQCKICHEIQSIPDKEQVKLTLQKLRVIIITLFLKLNKLMAEIESEHSDKFNKYFLEWNKYSEQILITTSAILIGYHQGRTENKIIDTLKGTLKYLQISMSVLDNEISHLY
ncbi:MAG TPA: hypothetical protein VH481_06380 [Nitrososphaeraceae archaeon]